MGDVSEDQTSLDTVGRRLLVALNHELGWMDSRTWYRISISPSNMKVLGNAELGLSVRPFSRTWKIRIKLGH